MGSSVKTFKLSTEVEEKTASSVYCILIICAKLVAVKVALNK